MQLTLMMYLRLPDVQLTDGVSEMTGGVADSDGVPEMTGCVADSDGVPEMPRDEADSDGVPEMTGGVAGPYYVSVVRARLGSDAGNWQ